MPEIGDKVNVYACSRTDSGYGEAIYMGEMDGQPMVKIEETGRIVNTRRIVVDKGIIYSVNLINVDKRQPPKENRDTTGEES